MIYFKNYLRHIAQYSLLDPNIAITFEKDNFCLDIFLWFVYMFSFIFLSIFAESAMLEYCVRRQRSK